MAKIARKSPQAQLSPTDAELENKILNYFLLFFSCALIGWLWEVAISFAQYGIFINRGVLHGPWLPIYGFGGLGIIILLKRFRKHPLVVFLSSIVLCGTIEYFTGWYLETFKHMKWWDYSGDFMNLHGRICLLALTSFGLAALFLVYFAYPKLIAFFNKIPIKPKRSSASRWFYASWAILSIHPTILILAMVSLVKCSRLILLKNSIKIGFFAVYSIKFL